LVSYELRGSSHPQPAKSRKPLIYNELARCPSLIARHSEKFYHSHVTHDLDLGLLRCIESREEACLQIATSLSASSPAAAPQSATVNSSQMEWLALSLTPGLDPTRGKKLVEFFGAVANVFHASLTELEAAGLAAAAAQAIGTGRPIELAHEQVAKATARRESNW
jgi:hypothetical protein